MAQNILCQIFFDKNNNWDKFVKHHGKLADVFASQGQCTNFCGGANRQFVLFVVNMISLTLYLINELNNQPFRPDWV